MKKLIEKIRDHYEEKAIIKFIKKNMSKMNHLHQEIKDMREMDYQDQIQEQKRPRQYKAGKEYCHCGGELQYFWKNGIRQEPTRNCDECELEIEAKACAELSAC